MNTIIDLLGLLITEVFIVLGTYTFFILLAILLDYVFNGTESEERNEKR